MAKYRNTIDDRNESVTERVKLIENKRYIIEVIGDVKDDGLRDPVLSIIGENGDYAENDDGGKGKDAQLAFAPNKTQYYDVSVSGGSRSTGDFVLTVNRDDFRNAAVGAAPAGRVSTNGESERGKVNYGDDADVFELSLIAGLTYGLRMLPGGGEGGRIDPHLTLLSERGRRIESDDDSGSGNEAFILYEAERTGDYWLRAEDSGDEGGSYVVRAGIGQGSPSRDRVNGGEAGDWINVLGGNDAVRGGDGDDRLWGASGRDELDGEDGSDRLLGGLGRDALDGGLGSDDLLGEDGRDVLDGGNGNDSLDGGEGNDVTSGGRGRDAVQGGLGDDRLRGDDGDDQVYGGHGDDRVQGGVGNDIVVGEDGDDRLDGGEGDDQVYAGIGQDTVVGGLDDDYLLGENGDDRVRGGEGDDYLEGGSQNDALFGASGTDALAGSDGEDALQGGEDGDYLSGGTGADLFIFTAASDSVIEDPDTVEGFDRAGPADGDVIDLSAIDADSTAAGDQAFAFDDQAGEGAVWLEDDGAPGTTATLVQFSTDDDPAPEFLLRIDDGRGVSADEYSELDFIL